MNKLIFASLLSVGAILAAQAPASPAPATTSKTAKVKAGKKHHGKKAAATSTNVKPAVK